MTEESLASRSLVEAKLRELIGRLHTSDDGARTLKETLPEPRILSVRVPDLDAEYWTELAGGRMGPLHRGAPPAGHIAVTASSDDLVRLVDGHESLFSAYLAGRVRVRAGFGDLLRLRRLAS